MSPVEFGAIREPDNDAEVADEWRLGAAAS